MQLSEVLNLFRSPLSEEQCWAVCYGACRMLNAKRTEDFQRREKIKYLINFNSIMLTQRGVIEILHSEPHHGDPQRDSQLIFDLGNIICRCLDYGLNDSEINEVKFNDNLAELIGGMVLQSVEFDEGIGDSDNLAESWESRRFSIHRNFKALIEVARFCEERLVNYTAPTKAKHYLNVCKALYIEASELKAFLGHVMNFYTVNEDSENSALSAKYYVKEWSMLWLRVMNELRQNTEKHAELFPEDYRHVPYEVNKYLNKPSRDFNTLPPDAENTIIDFLRSRITPTSTPVNSPVTTPDDTVKSISLADTESSHDIKDVINEDRALMVLPIEYSLVDKISTWDLSSTDDILEESFGNFTPERPKKILSLNENHLNELMNYDDFDLDDRYRSTDNNSLFDENQMYLDELDIEQDNDDFTEEKVGASLTEILIIRQELTRAEVETSYDKDLINKKKCFSCRKTKFSLFQRSRNCAVCNQYFCLKCIHPNVRVPSHLSDSLPANINITHGIVDSPRSIISGLGSIRHGSTSDINWFKKQQQDGVHLNTCGECKDFFESIENERKKKSEWTVRLQLDL